MQTFSSLPGTAARYKPSSPGQLKYIVTCGETKPLCGNTATASTPTLPGWLGVKNVVPRSCKATAAAAATPLP